MRKSPFPSSCTLCLFSIERDQNHHAAKGLVIAFLYGGFWFALNGVWGFYSPFYPLPCPLFSLGVVYIYIGNMGSLPASEFSVPFFAT